MSAKYKDETDCDSDHTAREAIFTANDFMLLNAVLKASDSTTRPDVDWAAIALILGSKNGVSVRERFRILTNKWGWFKADKGKNGSKADKANKSQPVTPAPKSSKAKASSGSGRCTRTRAKSGRFVSQKLEDEDSELTEYDDTPVPKKRKLNTPKKNSTPASNCSI
jgi:hypothetical protein